jgi:heme-degrading monooxygenase HmoA
LLKEIRIKAMDHPGYISGESLVNHYNTQNIMIISTWQTFADWISWQESKEREAAESRLEVFLEEPTKYEVYDLGVLSKKKNFLI